MMLYRETGFRSAAPKAGFVILIVPPEKKQPRP